MKITNRTMKFLVDYRERNSGTIDYLKQNEIIDLEFCSLPLGDYLIDDRLLFERKTFMDLTQSIKDCRLFRQASRLASNPIPGIILLEGTSRDLAASQMKREAIQGALIAISVILGIPLLRSIDPEESVRLMVYTAQQIRRFSGDAFPRRGRRPGGKRKIQLRILQGLPNIGPKRARNLLEYFGNVENVINAGETELAEVSGIGGQTAKKMKWSVKERKFIYNNNAMDLF